jgi:alkylation response protein AidB-like acyl-CoA dehydrogenase
MTEKQGGSDVRANTTRAEPAGPAGEFLLTGHKWFCSAPMCDAFLALAQAPGGLACFLLPRVLPDGGRNRFHLQRLKDKLGNRANASAEVELDRAWARLLGEQGRGAPPSSRWSTTRGWTAWSARRRCCARRSPRPATTPPTAAPSAAAWPTSR